MLLKCCFTSTETVGLLGTGTPAGRPPRLSHSSWALNSVFRPWSISVDERRHGARGYGLSRPPKRSLALNWPMWMFSWNRESQYLTVLGEWLPWRVSVFNGVHVAYTLLFFRLFVSQCRSCVCVGVCGWVCVCVCVWVCVCVGGCDEYVISTSFNVSVALGVFCIRCQWC